MTEIELEALAAKMFSLSIDKNDWEDVSDLANWLRTLPDQRLKDLSEAYLRQS